MIKKMNIKEMLETHLDKIVLGVIGLVSLYLLWTFVVGNPYGAEVGGRKMGPGDIDLQNRQQAQQLAEMLNQPAAPVLYDQRISAEFETLMQSALPGLAVGLAVPYPGVGTQMIADDRIYPIPEIVPLSKVQIALIRGAVHKPTDEIGPDTPYSSVSTELGDLDLVTVSGQIDTQALYRNFQQSFMGPRLNVAWREQSFAKPIFARIELQRRQRLSDGTWSSEWETVPQSQIASFQKLYEQTPMTMEEMQFGDVMMWTRQYEDSRVQLDILQPVAYDFASLQIPWLPPKYYDEAQTILKKQEEAARRAAREERMRARETGGGVETMPGGMPGGRQPGRDTRPQPTRPQPQPRTPSRTGPDMMMPGMMDPATTPARTAAAARRERTLDDIQKDMEKEFINEKTKLETLRDPLLVWAHDDTAQPGQTYQYRMRFGVFNPIAGSNWFREDQTQYKNQIVLWSPYSLIEKEISVPKMMHVFPTEVLSKEVVGGVKVDVAKYHLGQWHTYKFDVFPGQLIGEEVEKNAESTAAGPVMTMPMGMGTGLSSEPQKVDFSTSYMLVDINNVVSWGTTFNRSEYPQILYCGPESVLQTLPVGSNNWSAQMRSEYKEIKDAEENALPLNTSRSTTMPMGGASPASPTAPVRPMPDMLMMPMDGF